MVVGLTSTVFIAVDSAKMVDLSTRVDIEWSCPTCTFINKAGSFKCTVCGTVKGTATRQAKYHLSTLEQQYISETLQSTRIQNARSLAKLQALSQASAGTSHSDSPISSSPPPSSSSSHISNTLSYTSNSSHSTSSKQFSAIKKKPRVRISSGLNSKVKSPQTSKWPKLKNIDRSRIIRSQDITINDVTVTITEYPLLYPDSE